MFTLIHTDARALGQIDQNALRISIGVEGACAMQVCMREVVSEDTGECIVSSEERLLAARGF